MPNHYKCENCGKEFPQKSNYIYHLNRKRPCVKQTDTDELTCDKCKKHFSTKSSLSRHIKKYCTTSSHHNEDYNNLQNQLLKIQEELQQLKNTKNEETNNTYNQTINNTFNFNLNHNPFGQENYSYISDTEFKNIMSKGMQSVITLVNRLHFDENHPENHNIYISNISSGYILVFDGKNWNLIPNSEGLTNLLDNGSNLLEKKQLELFDSLDNSAKRMFSRFITARDEDAPVIKEIKKDLKVLLYNKRSIPLSSKKLLSD